MQKYVRRTHLSIEFSGGMHFHAVQHRNLLIRNRIRLKSSMLMATSATWKRTCPPLLTTFSRLFTCIGEKRMIDVRFPGWTPHGACRQLPDFFLKDSISGQPHDVLEGMLFKIFVDF